jgi:hypothetical protein
MSISRLALSNPSATTDTLIYTSSRDALVSIIAANKNSSYSSSIRVWIQPSGSSDPSQYSYIAYDWVIPALNSFETFRFPIANGDAVYVRSSVANVSFSLNGIYDSNGTSNITTGTSYPSSPTTGDIFVNTNTSTVYYWSGSAWVPSSGPIGATGPTGAASTVTGPTGPTGTAYVTQSTTGPSGPVNGQIWYKTDTGQTMIWYDSYWVEVSSGFIGPTGPQGPTGPAGSGGSGSSADSIVTALMFGGM